MGCVDEELIVEFFEDVVLEEAGVGALYRAYISRNDSHWSLSAVYQGATSSYRQIGEGLGFSDQFYFSRAFSKMHNHSPSEHRRRYGA